jgi:hypothetical protein
LRGIGLRGSRIVDRRCLGIGGIFSIGRLRVGGIFSIGGLGIGGISQVGQRILRARHGSGSDRTTGKDHHADQEADPQEADRQ